MTTKETLTSGSIGVEAVVTRMIPVDPLNRWRTEVTGSVNGVTFRLPIGKPVSVPLLVADVLDHSDYLGNTVTIPEFRDR